MAVAEVLVLSPKASSKPIQTGSVPAPLGFAHAVDVLGDWATAGASVSANTANAKHQLCIIPVALRMAGSQAAKARQAWGSGFMSR